MSTSRADYVLDISLMQPPSPNAYTLVSYHLASHSFGVKVIAKGKLAINKASSEFILCLFTVCKVCIVKYLQSNKDCPICNAVVHETQPVLNLRYQI